MTSIQQRPCLELLHKIKQEILARQLPPAQRCTAIKSLNATQICKLAFCEHLHVLISMCTVRLVCWQCQ